MNVQFLITNYELKITNVSPLSHNRITTESQPNHNVSQPNHNRLTMSHNRITTDSPLSHNRITIKLAKVVEPN
jgi:hypothetical protein